MFSHAIRIALRRRIADHNSAQDESIQPQTVPAIVGMAVAARTNGWPVNEVFLYWNATEYS